MRFVLAVLLLMACGDEAPVDRSSEARGAYAVGTARFESEGRTFQSFYPTEAAESEVPFEALEAEPLRTQYAQLLAAADPACPTRSLRVAVDAPASAGAFPLVLYSHCYTCTRLNNASAAAQLASHGFVVLAVDHAGGTLWNALAGDATALDATALAARVADLQAGLAADHASLGGADRTRIGSLGHSFGAITAGRIAELDARVGAAAALAAPMENPLIPGVSLAALDLPLLFLVAREDNSITELGNELIRSNFAEAPAAAWKLEVADAGHWSVSDLAGLVEGFAPGCGAGERQTDGLPFDYLPAATGRAITAAYVTAFFRATLGGDADAAAYLDHAFPDASTVDVMRHD